MFALSEKKVRKKLSTALDTITGPTVPSVDLQRPYIGKITTFIIAV